MKAFAYVCLVASLLAGTRSYGQFGNNDPHSTEFRGKITDGSTAIYSGFIVEVANLRDRTIRQRIDVMSDGSFWFRSIPEGDYELRLLNIYGGEVFTTVTSVGPNAQVFEIRMPESKLARPATGIVSIQQLNHPPSKQVKKLLENGQRLIAGEHYADAVVRFREAAQDDPQCVQAHVGLGLALAMSGDWEGSAAEYRSAVALNARNSPLHSNLSAALAQAGHLEEAEQEAATALKLDPANAKAHLTMAGILLRKGTVARAVPHLVAVQDQFPSAKAALEKICGIQRLNSCP